MRRRRRRRSRVPPAAALLHRRHRDPNAQHLEEGFCTFERKLLEDEIGHIRVQGFACLKARHGCSSASLYGQPIVSGYSRICGRC